MRQHTHRWRQTLVACVAILVPFAFSIAALSTQNSALASDDLGNLSANPFNYESSSNPFGKGNPFAPNGIIIPTVPTAARSATGRRPIPSPPMRQSDNPQCL